jgi:stress response protein YsnF
MELHNSETNNNNNNNNDTIIQEKNKNKIENITTDKNRLIVSPLHSEKITIIVKPQILENRESLKSKIEGALDSVKENASNIVDKVVKGEEQDINSFKRDTESISQPKQQQKSIEEFVIPVIGEKYSFSKKVLSEDINIEKRWEEKDELKIPVRYEKLFVNDKEIDVYSKHGIISQIKEKISDLVHSDGDDDSETKENDDDNKKQNDNKDNENQKRKEPQLNGESVPLFDSQQTENNTALLSQSNNNKELTNNNKYETLIPLYAEEITISKKMIKVGEVVISKRRVVATEDVNVDTLKEQIKVEYADGRKEKITE